MKQKVYSLEKLARILNKENGTETIMVDDLSGSVYIVNLNFNSIFIKKKIIIE